MKCIVIQPTAGGHDLVYLFTNATNGQPAKVYYREEGMEDWVSFSAGYPAGMHVNMAFPFYRDGKLRAGGNASVWESPMAETTFTPIINPWVEKSFYNCMTDTLYFDDHSILNHTGASWHWEISPSLAFLENADTRNPKVVLGSPGSYTVTLTVTQGGQTYSKTIPGMVTATTCPSIDDCSNPAELPKNEWSLIYVDSEETNYPGLATMSFDDDPETIWHTRWSTGDDLYPHEIQVSLGRLFRAYSFSYLPRQDGENGRIKEYELYVSEDSLDWGVPVMTGEFVNSASPQTITFEEPIVGKYFRLVALSEVNGNPWASAAEFSMTGCTDITFGADPGESKEELMAFPVPTGGKVTVSIPSGSNINYTVISATGQVVCRGKIIQAGNTFSTDLAGQAPGIYFIFFIDENGVQYSARVVKN
jgi:PKD repeat protein